MNNEPKNEFCEFCGMVLNLKKAVKLDDELNQIKEKLEEFAKWKRLKEELPKARTKKERARILKKSKKDIDFALKYRELKKK